jgi:hypothetical protein
MHAVVELPDMKPCEFIGSSKDDISSMPQQVKDAFGFAIRAAQRGSKRPDAKPLKGFGGAGVIEVVENFDSDDLRAARVQKEIEARGRNSQDRYRPHQAPSQSRGGKIRRANREQ